MELKVKGKFVSTSKVKKIQKPSCPILEKINENYDKKVVMFWSKQKKNRDWGFGI